MLKNSSAGIFRRLDIDYASQICIRNIRDAFRANQVHQERIVQKAWKEYKTMTDDATPVNKEDFRELLESELNKFFYE